MNIPDRIKRFIKHTNSLCIIMEENEPAYLLSSFDWAERMMIPHEEEIHDLSEIERLNDDISLLVGEEKEEELSLS